MKYIENEIYYHIQAKGLQKESFWEVGSTYIIGDQKNPFSSFFDIADLKPVNDGNVYRHLYHYQRLSREMIFEEVRREHFSELPSRLYCLWVMPEEQSSIEYWKTEIPGEKRFLLKLELSGVIHKANQKFLDLNFDSMNTNRDRAFKYWSGSTGSGQIEDEFLFIGTAKVLESNPI